MSNELKAACSVLAGARGVRPGPPHRRQPQRLRRRGLPAGPAAPPGRPQRHWAQATRPASLVTGATTRAVRCSHSVAQRDQVSDWACGLIAEYLPVLASWLAPLFAHRLPCYACPQARQQLSLMLDGLAGIGVPSVAISEVLARCRPWRSRSSAIGSMKSSWLPCPPRKASVI